MTATNRSRPDRRPPTPRKRTPRNRAARKRALQRRGNTIVLAAAVLVLLVIIATAYITRTQAGRITGEYIKDADKSAANAEVIAEDVADEIASALFVRPVDLTELGGFDWENLAVSANAVRIDPNTAFDVSRYNTDQRDRDGNGIVDFELPYNFAPYHTVPFTNWPDPASFAVGGGPGLNPTHWPEGEGNVDPGTLVDALLSDGNPIGNPGFGDTRWLRDAEPMRMPKPVGGPPIFQGNEIFYQWRKLTNLSRPGNGYRIIRDISDISNAGTPFDALYGGVINDLDNPVEQWIPVPPAALSVGNPGWPVDVATGDAIVPGDFVDRWYDWFESLSTRGAMHVHSPGDPPIMPPNYLNLSNLNGGSELEDGERPEDEFKVGAARWYVSRVLADSDGDGFTDAFWHLVPTPMMDGIITIAAVSIVDNSAMINPNVATRFDREDTTGATPADVALVGENVLVEPGNLPGSTTYNVGLYDNHFHQSFFGGAGIDGWRYWWPRWERHAPELGLFTAPPPGSSEVPELTIAPDHAARMRHFQNASGGPVGADPTSGYTPFELSSELELRMFHGQNYPWIFSRYESSVQAVCDGGDCAPYPPLLRGTFDLEISDFQGQGGAETVETDGQLSNYEFTRDSRHRITMYSAARNDLLAPWLRWDQQWMLPQGDKFIPASTFDGVLQGPATATPPAPGAPDHNAYRDAFQEHSRRKLDLRERFYEIDERVDRYEQGRPALPDRLAESILMALTEDRPFTVGTGPYLGNGYLGEFELPTGSGTLPADAIPEELQNVRRLAAGYAANILSYRDADDPLELPVTLAEAMPLPAYRSQALTSAAHANVVPEDTTTRFLGMEPQPFLTEAFIAHVYGSQPVPHVSEGEQENNGEPVLPLFGEVSPSTPDDNDNYTADDHYLSTVVVVQVANPYDRPINLANYRIRVFGQEAQLVGPGDSPWLPPATDDYPVTATFYAIEESVNHETLGVIGTADGNDDADDFHMRWLDFLDLERDFDIPLECVVRDVNDIIPGDPQWSTDRDDYFDNSAIGANGRAVELVRVDASLNQTDPDRVVIDRFDYEDGHRDKHEFRNRVLAMEDHTEPEARRPPREADPIWIPVASAQPGDASVMPGIRIGKDDYYVTWTRVTRAWGSDFNYVPSDVDTYGLQGREHAPRFVFATQQVTESEKDDATFAFSADFGVRNAVLSVAQTAIGGSHEGRSTGDAHDPTTHVEYYNGDHFSAWGPHAPPPITVDGVSVDGDNPDRTPWFVRRYHDSTNTPRYRKPTFFNNRAVFVGGDPFLAARYSPFEGGPHPYNEWFYGGTEPLDLLARTGVPDKGFYLREQGVAPQGTDLDACYPLQMLHRDADFEQIGEVLNVFLFGHELEFAPGGQYRRTAKTFAEFMEQDEEDPILIGDDALVNRLRIKPTTIESREHNEDQLTGEMLGRGRFEVDVNGDGTPDANNIAGLDGAADPRHAHPAMPAGLRVLDLFTLDGPGVNADPDYDGDGLVWEEEDDVLPQSFRLAGGFSDAATFGLININTASPEVLSAMPHMSRMIRSVDETLPSAGVALNVSASPFVNVARSMVQYRERFGSTLFVPGFGTALGDSQANGALLDDPQGRWRFANQPNYVTRDEDPSAPDGPVNLDGVRGDRGFASAAELLLLDRPGTFTLGPVNVSDSSLATTFLNGSGMSTEADGFLFDQSWRIDFPAWLANDTIVERNDVKPIDPVLNEVQPFFGTTTRISTDVSNPQVVNSTGDGLVPDLITNTITGNDLPRPDFVAGDVEEQNLLFNGISNIVTTRSDTFTVYMRIRQVRQNPQTGKWNALDPEYIVDDSRYVMLVDRSNVNSPTDKPKILYFEKVPD